MKRLDPRRSEGLTCGLCDNQEHRNTPRHKKQLSEVWRDTRSILRAWARRRQIGADLPNPNPTFVQHGEAGRVARAEHIGSGWHQEDRGMCSFTISLRKWGGC